MILMLGIVVLTHESHSETPDSPSNGHAQSPGRPGDRRVVQRQRLLRSQRPPAGEIRNVAARSQGRLHREASRTAVWLFASLLLSGSGDIRAGWPGGAGTAEARTERRSQAVAKDHGIPPADHRCRCLSESGCRRAEGVRHLRPPAERRAGVSASEKKTTVAIARYDCPADRTDSSEQVTRYEDLRRHVIDDGCGHRLGLALFHREGMKAWLDAWSTCATRGARPTPNRSCDPVRQIGRASC